MEVATRLEGPKIIVISRLSNFVIKLDFHLKYDYDV